MLCINASNPQHSVLVNASLLGKNNNFLWRREKCKDKVCSKTHPANANRARGMNEKKKKKKEKESNMKLEIKYRE